MTDFFSRLAERALSIAPTILPIIAPLYGSEQQHIDASLFDSIAEEEIEEPNPLSTTIPTRNTRRMEAPPTQLEPQHTQGAQPEVQHFSLSAARESTVQPIQTAKTSSLAEAQHSPEEATLIPPQPYPQLQRIVQQPIFDRANQTMDHNQSQPLITRKNVHEQADSHSQHSEHHLAATEPLTQKHTPTNSIKHEQISTLNSILPSYQRKAVIPARDTTNEAAISTGQINQVAPAIVKNGTTSPLQAINHYHKRYHKQHSWAVKEAAKEAPVVPIIQVTIGRIEVRATTAPVENTPAQRQQATPPVMSLDDYLHQRAKGGY